MLQNYIKITIRQFIRHRGYSFINITGLAVGMTCCILILLWIQDEISYDRFHVNKENIYRVCITYEHSGETTNHWRTPPPLAEALKIDYPEIVDAARHTVNKGDLIIKYENKRFRESIAFPETIATITYRLFQELQI